jgi:hypothetical protein
VGPVHTPCFVNSAPPAPALAALALLCSALLCSALLCSALTAPARQAPQLGCLIVQVCSGDQAQTCESRAVHSQPEQMLFGLWSFMCEAEQNTTRWTGQWACIPAAWESPTPAKGQRARSILSWKDFLRLPLSQPQPPFFHLRLKQSRGELMAVQPGADDDMEVLALPQTLT